MGDNSLVEKIAAIVNIISSLLIIGCQVFKNISIAISLKHLFKIK